MNIILIGFMGAGKSTLGNQLANSLDWNFIDTDELIEQKYGSIEELFEISEEYFRKIEKNVCLSINTSDNVIALGGGAILSPEIQDHFSNDYIIYLDVSLEVIKERIKNSNRPLKNNADELYNNRRQKYDEIANLKVTNNVEFESVLHNVSKSVGIK